MQLPFNTRLWKAQPPQPSPPLSFAVNSITHPYSVLWFCSAFWGILNSRGIAWCALCSPLKRFCGSRTGKFIGFEVLARTWKKNEVIFGFDVGRQWCGTSQGQVLGCSYGPSWWWKTNRSPCPFFDGIPTDAFPNKNRASPVKLLSSGADCAFWFRVDSFLKSYPSLKA